MRENDIAKTLSEPSPKVIEVVWENLPDRNEIALRTMRRSSRCSLPFWPSLVAKRPKRLVELPSYRPH